MIALLLPFAVPVLAGRCSQRLTPFAALWLLTLTMVVLAGGSLVALGSRCRPAC